MYNIASGGDSDEGAGSPKNQMRKTSKKRPSPSKVLLTGNKGLKESLIHSEGEETKIDGKRRHSSTTDVDSDTSSDDGRLSQGSDESGNSGSSLSSGGSVGSNFGGNRKELIQRKGFSKYRLHLELLMKKNYWIFSRNLKLTMIQLLAPIAFCLLIVFF